MPSSSDPQRNVSKLIKRRTGPKSVSEEKVSCIKKWLTGENEVRFTAEAFLSFYLWGKSLHPCKLWLLTRADGADRSWHWYRSTGGDITVFHFFNTHFQFRFAVLYLCVCRCFRALPTDNPRNVYLRLFPANPSIQIVISFFIFGWSATQGEEISVFLDWVSLIFTRVQTAGDITSKPSTKLTASPWQPPQKAAARSAAACVWAGQRRPTQFKTRRWPLAIQRQRYSRPHRGNYCNNSTLSNRGSYRHSFTGDTYGIRLYQHKQYWLTSQILVCCPVFWKYTSESILNLRELAGIQLDKMQVVLF